jgi:hypothetical protein
VGPQIKHLLKNKADTERQYMSKRIVERGKQRKSAFGGKRASLLCEVPRLLILLFNGVVQKYFGMEMLMA